MYMGRPLDIIVINEDFIKLAENYYKHLLQLGYSSQYTKMRYLFINEFFSYLEQKGQTRIDKITTGQIIEYYNYISHRPNKTEGGTLSEKSTYAHMRNIRGLFIMLQHKRQIKINPCSTLKIHYPASDIEERTVLTQKEIKELYKATETSQERAILSMAYGCGLRVGELVKCDIENVRLREKILIVPDGKNSKRRVVPMSSGTIKDLTDYYYNERDELTKGRKYNPRESAFMLNLIGGRMQKWTYNYMLKELIKRSRNASLQEKEVTMHTLRHSIATHLIEKGVKVEHVRMFLGHSQLESTQIYIHISKEILKSLAR